MAKIYPNIDKVRVIFPSSAEEQVYNLLRKLSVNWVIYYSCTLSSFESEQGLVDNEIDFVLYHPKYGVVVLEVKGGRISYDPSTQQYRSENRYGELFDIKNPFNQALNWKSRFIRILKKKEIRVPVTHAVCLPSVNEDDFLEKLDLENGILLGRGRLNDLERSLINLVTQAQPEKFLSFSDVGDDLDKLLRGSIFSSKQYLKDYIDYQEKKVLDVQWMQDTLVTPIVQTKRIAIEGEAGTGKTVLAAAIAKHFRDLGSSVLFLSSNPLLNEWLKGKLPNGIEIETYSEFASKFGVELLKRPHGFEGSREDWIQYVGPEKLKSAVLSSDKRYDVMICDEAQDVQPFWWESIECALRNEDSCYYIFFDRSQGVFGSGSAEHSFVPEDVLPIPGPYFPLIHNYRTTKEIAGFSRAFRTGRQILMSHSNRLGYVPEVISYVDADDGRKILGALLNKLCFDEGVNQDDITILSARRAFHDQSIFEGNREIGDFLLRELGAKNTKVMGGKKCVNISTVASFKGLETRVAIVCNFSEYQMPFSNPIMSSLMYVACTRAKHMLYLLVRKDDPKRDFLMKSLDSLQRKGPLTVGDDSSNHSYIGTISYFNPDRLGWIKIEENSGQSNQILFLSSDVKHLSRENLKIGSKLSFRVKQEGFMSIAVDIQTLTE